MEPIQGRLTKELGKIGGLSLYVNNSDVLRAISEEQHYINQFGSAQH